MRGLDPARQMVHFTRVLDLESVSYKKITLNLTTSCSVVGTLRWYQCNSSSYLTRRASKKWVFKRTISCAKVRFLKSPSWGSGYIKQTESSRDHKKVKEANSLRYA